jgi:hypothetical protein
MNQLSPLRARLVSLYRTVDEDNSRSSLSPIGWRRGKKYINRDLTSMRRRPADEKMELTTTNAMSYVNPTKDRLSPLKLKQTYTKTRRRHVERFPPIPFGFNSKPAKLSLDHSPAPKRPESGGIGDFTDTLRYWGGTSVSPTIKTYNRKRDFMVRWEAQANSKGTIRPF